MKIACLGWGSLVWRPEGLNIHRQWFQDGPILPVEFSRQSQDGRLTLVINEAVSPVRTLWALMNCGNLEEAKVSLQKREGIPSRNISISIGAICAAEKTDDPIKATILEWASKMTLDAVIWTNLKPKFNEQDKSPTLSEAIQYVNGLDINARQHAEEYVRKTPIQIDTLFRQAFEKEFGWTHIE